MKVKNKRSIVLLDLVQIGIAFIAVIVTLVIAILTMDDFAKSLIYAGNILCFYLLIDGISNFNEDIKMEAVNETNKVEILNTLEKTAF